MPYPRHRPASEEEMEKRMKGDNTLCNTLREMYRLTDNPEIRMKCRMAFSMGKAMCEKLMEYRDEFGATAPEFQDGI